MFYVIIPARFHSTRLPGKVLADIHGKSMLAHVYDNAKKSKATAVYIATDDARVQDAASQFCPREHIILTGTHHVTGTERIAEATAKINLPDDAILVGMQADEPLVPGEWMNKVAFNIAEHGPAMATLAQPIYDIKHVLSPDVVKVIRNIHHRAIYFSRAAIPFSRSFTHEAQHLPHHDYLQHFGIYAYRHAFLKQFVALERTSIESVESLEQLRALHYGFDIHVDLCQGNLPPGVDTPADLENTRHYLAQRS